jgi:hypothetical protein
MQNARDLAMRQDFEPVNDPNQVQSGSITFTTDDDLAKMYGVNIEKIDDDNTGSYAGGVPWMMAALWTVCAVLLT